MNKRVAIITGASGGIGKEFVKIIIKEEVDEVWIVGRNEAKLMELKKEYGDKIVVISKDLSKSEKYVL